MSTKHKLLLIGKVPPPLGGVTIHVQRLLDVLGQSSMPYVFVPLSVKKILMILLTIPKTHVFHLHSSNAFIQFVFVIWSRFWFSKSIITVHRDIRRYRGLSRFFVELAVRYCYCPIVLNESSFEIAWELNKNCRKISAFIPPVRIEQLERDVAQDIGNLKLSYTRLFSTNASALSYDVDGVEIYGVLDLIRVFSDLGHAALIVSDPSGQYKHYLSTNNITVPDNVYLIAKPHAYFEVLKHVDGNIRNTSTDGDAISVKESLYLRVPTYVTNVVSRPPGTITFKRGEYDFLLKNINADDLEVGRLDGIEELLTLYSDALIRRT